MSSRAVARVGISFGMVHVGIKLYLAAKSEGISFNQINSKTGNRVGQKFYDKGTGDEVLNADIVKGYEYAKDQYVTFTDDEIDNMQAEKRDTLDIKEFVPLTEIVPLHVEKTYYTGPDKGMDKSYTFLYQLLKTYNKAAVGTWASRGKEHLIVIRAYEHGLIMHQMFYNTEVRAFDNMCAAIPITPVELAMGKVLMDQFSKDAFDKSKYSDKFVEKVMSAVEVKRNGGTITASEPKLVNINMSDALRASLKALGMETDKIEEFVAKASGAPVAAPVVAAPTKKTNTKSRPGFGKARKTA